MSKIKSILSLCTLLALSAPVLADDKPAVICNIKVLSDKVQDVSSLEAWKKSTIKDGVSDQDKALAIWKSVVGHIYDTTPPKEFLTWEDSVGDPIKCMNVYGYQLCNDVASTMCGLSRYAGFKAQGLNLQGHNAMDIWYDGGWHYLDAAFTAYFPKADGKLACSDEIYDSVKKWYAEHPDMNGDANMNNRRKFAKDEGWKNGPEVMRNSPLFDKDGNSPYSGKGFFSETRQFDGRNRGIYETGYNLGYKVNIQLREGEKLIRNWSNKGLHVNQLGGNGGEPTILNATVGKGDLKHTPAYGDLANGRIGNGTLEYNALADTQLATSALTFDNLQQFVAAGDGVSYFGWGAKDPAKDGTLVIRMPSSYVYLSGELALNANIGNAGSIAISLSDNNGLDWKDVFKIDKSGEQKIDLKKFVGRRYDYRLKFTLKGSARLVGLKLTHDIQHSQRPLPALDKGDNTITFSTGPQESTITIEGSTTAANKEFNLTLADFHPTMENMESTAGLKMTGGKGSITFPIETPGEMSALRVSTFFRARDARDVFDIEASFDEGKTWKPISKTTGGFRFMGDYATLTDIPKNTTKALVRHSGTQGNTLMIFDLRIDADYKTPNSGFAPVKVTYLYDEAGKEIKNEKILTKPTDTYTIHCDTKPTMKSITLERAP